MTDLDAQPGPQDAVPSPARRRVFRWILALVLPVLLLGLAEFGLRAAGYEYDVDGPIYRFHNLERLTARSDPQSPFVDDPRLFWRMRPRRVGALQVSTNSRGFRTPEFLDRKDDEVYRILCVGDSTTCGVLVAETSAWPRRLEAILTERGSLPADRVEVINLGVPGYTSLQGLRLLEDEGLALSPDAVVAAFGAFNDWVPAVVRPDALVGDRSGWAGLRLFQLATEWTREDPQQDPSRQLGLDWTVIRTEDHTGPRRVPLADYRANLTRIAELGHGIGARVVFLTQPIPPSTIGSNPIVLEYRDATAATAQLVDAELADGWAAFEASGRPPLVLFRDFCHPRELGHELLARCVADALTR